MYCRRLQGIKLKKAPRRKGIVVEDVEDLSDSSVDGKKKKKGRKSKKKKGSDLTQSDSDFEPVKRKRKRKRKSSSSDTDVSLVLEETFCLRHTHQ